MTALEASWTLGVLIGGPIWAIVILGTITFTTAAFIAWRKANEYDRFELGFAWIGGLIALVAFLAIIISPLGYWPFKAEYHQWRTVEGEVQQVSKRLISAGKGFEERYVFVINGQPYGVDDTRASLIKAGDHVRLSCRREWQYASTHGYGCRWDQ